MRFLRNFMLAAGLLAFSGGMMTGCAKAQAEKTTPDKPTPEAGTGDGDACATGDGDACGDGEKKAEDTPDKDPDGSW